MQVQKKKKEKNCASKWNTTFGICVNTQLKKKSSASKPQFSNGVPTS